MSITSLVLASTLLVIPIFISYKEKLNIEKDIIISIIRAIIQLVIVGYILEMVFGAESKLLTLGLILIIIINASANTVKRSENIEKPFLISFIAIAIGSTVTLTILVLSRTIKFVPSEIIAVSGMVISNSMVAINLCYRNLNSLFKDKGLEVEVKLSLGSDIKTASMDIIRKSIKSSMIPTIDSAKTLGIVSLPGMMTGLILGGASPLLAIKFQIMVTFMILSATSLSVIIACYLGYKSFFNGRMQLKPLKG